MEDTILFRNVEPVAPPDLREEDCRVAESRPRGTLGTVHNSAVVLRQLATGPATQQLTNIAEAVDMTLPTVHRLLRSLVAAGLVEQDPRSSRYGLGSELVRLAEHYLAGLPALNAAGPYLVELRNATKGTVTVRILVRNEVVTVDRIEGEDIGGVFRAISRYEPVLESAAGRVLLAHLDKERWSEIAPLLGEDVPDDEQLRTWAAQPYLQMPASDVADCPEIAAPIFVNGCAVAALAVTGNPASFATEVLEDDMAPHLVRAARTISRALGRD